MNTLLNQIKQDEGFSPIVYKCSEGFDTFGFGTKLPIDKDEAELILNHRLKKTIAQVNAFHTYLNIPGTAWDILYNMAYQMGVHGLSKFKNMFEALKVNDYETAALEMLDSRWAKQTQNRANRLAERMRNER